MTTSRPGGIQRRHMLAMLAASGGLLAGGLVRVSQVQLLDWLRPQRLITVNGTADSGTDPIFSIPDLQTALADHGLLVKRATPGSRYIVGAALAQHDDFVAYSYLPDRLSQIHGRGYVFANSPLVVATFRSVVELLGRIQVAREASSGIWVFDLAAYLDAFQHGLAWDQIPGNTTFLSKSLVTLTTAKPATSLTAARFAALAAAQLNGGKPLASPGAIATVVGRLAPLFQRDGMLTTHLAELVARYFVGDESQGPAVLMREADFLARMAQRDPYSPTGGGDPRVMLYMTPTDIEVQTLMALSPAGDYVGQLLLGDVAQRVLAEAGFRSGLARDDGGLVDAMARHQLIVPNSLDDIGVRVMPSPSNDVLDALIKAVS